jgi:diaminohydroxyphosphoribosylaminopyrimidine deaminase/5-amino-6-(5-phosphoribosylamino)uracil reductase
MVGAVVVRGNRIVGRGYHHRAGEPHAEVLALQSAGEKARGATLYVTLEPCNHFGKTPPCTEAVLKAGIRKVVVGMKDPNPRVVGGGIRRLREAGIGVEVGRLEEACRELNAPFCKYATAGMPFVTLKGALTLDGKIATASGDSRWVTSPESRLEVHRLRRAADAVMIGIGTALKDDPLLNVRLPETRSARQPLRIVVDSRLRIPLASQIVRTAPQYPTLIAATPAASSSKIRSLEKRGVEVWVLPKSPQGKVNLRVLMKKLAVRGIVSVLLEGGAQINASALKAGLVDRFLFFFAPKVVGGVRAPGVVGGEGARRMRDAVPLQLIGVRRIGPDLLVEAKLSEETLQSRVANRHEWRTVVKAKRYPGLGARPVRCLES